MKITILASLEPGEKTPDVVVDQIASVLRAADHTVSILTVWDDVAALVAGLRRRQPDLVFNLLETFGGIPRADVAVAGVLETLRLPYTGSGPGELFIRQDKGLAKKVLAFDKIVTPDFAVFFHDADLETGGNLRPPFFVKPLQNDASIGITKDSLVHDTNSLMKQVAKIRKDLGDSALAEEYIPGREFYVGILGNREPLAFPPIEMDFSGLPDGAPQVLDSKAKWDKNSVEYKGTKAVLADLPDELKAKLLKVSLEAYRALKVRDYGRVDLRLSETGEIFVIEVNANCDLEQGSEFATAAAAAGLEYPALINRIIELSQERYAAAGVKVPAPAPTKKPAAAKKNGKKAVSAKTKVKA
jgi:D-alanine-D-alanine ligase